ncbi:hypothetical protein V7S43_008935 [Phytophthora oleae]|uniref:Uncharacterized protein n=1 Tax=Phytophthora oleae TaxID=2107226 RepID=A0ABD3FK95_9STRA
MEQVIVDFVNNFPADAEDDALRCLLEPHHSKQLRSACVKLKLNAQSRKSGNNNKQGYIELLVTYHRDKIDGELVALTGPAKEQEKQPERRVSQHDIFLLVNILFSPEFVDRMSEADKNQKRSALDTQSINERSRYWKDVTRVYTEVQESSRDSLCNACSTKASTQRTLSSTALLNSWTCGRRSQVDTR